MCCIVFFVCVCVQVYSESSFLIIFTALLQPLILVPIPVLFRLWALIPETIQDSKLIDSDLSEVRRA